jgi:hypothetical protein
MYDIIKDTDNSVAGESLLKPKYMGFPYTYLSMSSSEESLPTLTPNKRVTKRKGEKKPNKQR